MKDREKYTIVPTLENGALRIWEIRFDEVRLKYTWIMRKIAAEANVTSSPADVRVNYFNNLEWNSMKLAGCYSSAFSTVVLSGAIQIDFDNRIRTFGPAQLNGACYGAFLRDDEDPDDEINFQWRTIKPTLALHFFA